MFNTSTIFVTGGAGFIGSALVRYLIANTECRVVNIDKLTYAGNLDSVSDVRGHSRYCFEKVDICNPVELHRLFLEYQPDSVMHLAAESHVDRSIDGPAEFLQTNIFGTFTLLEQARQYYDSLSGQKRDGFRFLHVSTDEVFGDLPHPDDFSVLDKTALPMFTEETCYDPSSPYSVSKASSDQLVRAWHRTYGLPVLVSNCSNNYGPYHFPEKLIPLVILNALHGNKLPVYGQGNQIRDWLYVDDHVRALVRILERGVVSETYNIGGHNEKQNVEVVHMICEILNELVPVSENHKLIEELVDISGYEELITYVEDRPGHDRRYAIDAGKIQRELDWKPLETFESGIRKTVLWYLENRSWWEKVRDGSYVRIGINDSSTSDKAI